MVHVQDGSTTSESNFASIVGVSWLAQRLDDSNILVADCRFDLADPEAGQRAYNDAHIPGAVYFDLDRDLSAPPTKRGGRHPLPPVHEFAALFAERGIGDDVTVVCYDDSSGSMAARLWWMLRYIGHERVAVLDGGYPAWVDAELPVTPADPAGSTRTLAADSTQTSATLSALPVSSRRLSVRLQPHMEATASEVLALSEAGRGVIMDARAPERYRGEIEPLDPVAGHIPGAINCPWEDNLNEDGHFLKPRELAQRYAGLGDGTQSETVDQQRGQIEGEIVVHCGSGVTGCVNVLALERAGIKGVKLYAGGWSDWCSDPDNPIEVGDPKR